MNMTKLRSKRVLASTAAVAALAVGGGVWATTAYADDVRGGERDRVAKAAVAAAGGGTAIEVDAGDDRGAAYDVEVRLEDGTEVDVALDKDLKVVSEETDTDDGATTASAGPEPSGAPDADDRVLTAAEQASAEKAAVAAVPGGTVIDVDASDDRGVAYEVEVRATDKTEWDVELDAGFAVVRKTAE